MIHIGTFRDSCKSHGCPGCEPTVEPNRTVRVVLAPHVDEAIVTMGMGHWDMIVRMVKLAAQCSPRTDMQAMLAQVVAADNVARQAWAGTTGSDPR